VTPLFAARLNAMADLAEHRDEFDAILTGGDFHGLALGAIIAAAFDKPMMSVCQQNDHGCTVQHTVCYGDVTPGMRWLYVDDFFGFGRTLSTVFTYMNQVQQHVPGYPPANIVATYEATPRKYELLGEPAWTIAGVLHGGASGWPEAGRVVCGNTIGTADTAEPGS